MLAWLAGGSLGFAATFSILPPASAIAAIIVMRRRRGRFPLALPAVAVVGNWTLLSLGSTIGDLQGLPASWVLFGAWQVAQLIALAPVVALMLAVTRPADAPERKAAAQKGGAGRSAGDGTEPVAADQAVTTPATGCTPQPTATIQPAR